MGTKRSAPAPPPKGQKSIAAFFGGGSKAAAEPTTEPPAAKAPTADPAAASVDVSPPAAGPPPAGGVPRPSNSPVERPATTDAAEAPPAAKRARQAAGGGGGGSGGSGGGGGAPTVDKEALHRRWQDKVGREVPPLRPRTQQAVEEAAAAGGSRAAAGAPAGGLPLTPLEQQITALQAAHPDCVLAIEVGYKCKFFGRDAEAASRALRIGCWPDRNFLSCWVPLARLHVYVRRLCEAGLRVGVVRQVETVASRRAAGTSASARFERRLTAVYSRATLDAGAPLPGEMGPAAGGGGGGEDEGAAEAGPPAPAAAGAAGGWSSERLTNYLMCVVEEPGGGGSRAGHVRLGVVAVEVSTGDVLYSELLDGPMRAGLEARLLFAAPAELVLAVPASAPTERLLAASPAARGAAPQRAPAARYADGGALAAVSAFYGGGGGGGAAAAAASAAVGAVLALPPLVLRALAHALDHLRPFKLEAVLRQAPSFREFSAAAELALSPNTLRQLEILRADAGDGGGGERGSLLWLCDRTLTPMGARALRYWVARPLRRAADIEARLDAVAELAGAAAAGDSAVLGALPGALKPLPDLEVLAARACLHGTATPSQFAALLRVFADLYRRLGLRGDLSAAAAAAAAPAAPAADGGGGGALFDAAPVPPVAADGVRSPLLLRLYAAAGDLRAPAAAAAALSWIDEAAAARNDVVGLLTDGSHFPGVAARRAELAAAEAALDALLPGLARAAGVPRLSYLSLQNQGTHLVEVPPDAAKRVPADWVRVSATKRAVRYRPPAVAAALREREAAADRLEAEAKAAWARLLREFGGHYEVFRAATRALAHLDCLNALAALASSPGYVRPEILSDDDDDEGGGAVIEITEGRHPVLDALLPGGCVPNDVALGAAGGAAPSVAVVTGPNMGGKSSFTRGAALICILAQVGSFVPARAARLTPLDAVLTRMGASDSLALGRSTFLEEMGEAADVLRAATRRSLVVLDELGRGTGTRDGLAIAQATLRHVAQRVGCPTLFVTHYPEIARLSGEPGLEGRVACFYMDYREDEAQPQHGDAAGSQGGAAGAAARAADTRITFLYRAVPGVAPRAYGLNVARLAGLPDAVVRRAAAKSAEFGGAAGGAAGGVLARARAAAAAAAAGGADPAALAALQAAARAAAA